MTWRKINIKNIMLSPYYTPVHSNWTNLSTTTSKCPTRVSDLVIFLKSIENRPGPRDCDLRGCPPWTSWRVDKVRPSVDPVVLRFLFICTRFMIEHDINMDKHSTLYLCIDDFSTIWKSNLKILESANVDWSFLSFSSFLFYFLFQKSNLKWAINILVSST